MHTAGHQLLLKQAHARLWHNDALSGPHAAGQHQCTEHSKGAT